MNQLTPVSDDTTLITTPLLTEKQLQFITKKTPQRYVKIRPGPGEKPLSYAEVGYIVQVLNPAFGWDWDFHIFDQQIGKRQVWVRGELTVRTNGRAIIKSQYGGSDIKTNRAGEAISIADDLKTATSDCLKKCASLLGVAGDIYWRDLDSSI